MELEIGPLCGKGAVTGTVNKKKAPDDAGAFKFVTAQGDNQYLATTGPVQLKR